MANHIGTVLTKLIREIAYAKGELVEIERSADRIQRRLEPLIQDYKKIRALRRTQLARLAELEAVLAECSGLGAQEIRVIRNLPKKLGLPHGAFVRELVAVLTKANAPIDTVSIVKQMARQLDLQIGTPTTYDMTRRSVVEKLRYLVRKGAVERLPSEAGANGRQVGRWRWKGL